jgi:predicted RNA-binding Zn-ribbon protein involved in translation (DUF1610 family)
MNNKQLRLSVKFYCMACGREEILEINDLRELGTSRKKKRCKLCQKTWESGYKAGYEKCRLRLQTSQGE